MIFKKIEDDANLSGGRIKTIFGDVSRFIQNTLSTQNVSFTYSNDLGTQLRNDIKSLVDYRTALKNGVDKTVAFSRHMQNTSVYAKKFAEDHDMSTMSLVKMANAQRKNAIAIQASDKSYKNINALISEFGNKCSTTKVSQADFISSVGKSNAMLAKYLSSLNGVKGSLAGYIGFTIKANAATLALNAGVTLLNTAFSMLVSWGISKAVSAIGAFINREKDAREEAILTGKAAEKEADKVRDLYGAYSDAKATYNGSEQSKQLLKTATEELLVALGLERAEIEELLGDYDKLNAKIDELSQDALKQALVEQQAGYAAAQKELVDKAGEFSNVVFRFGGIDTSAIDMLRKSGFDVSDAIEGYIGLGDVSSIDDALATYERFISMREKMSKEFSTEELADSGLYRAINDQIKYLEEEYKEYFASVQAVNSTAASLDYIRITGETGIPETKEEYDALRQSMIDAAKTNKDYVGTQKDVESSIDSLLMSIPSLAKLYNSFTEDTFKPEVITKFSFGELIADTDSETDFIDIINERKKLAEDLQKTLEDLRTGEEIDLPSLYEQFPDLASADDLESAITEMLRSQAEELNALFDDQFEILDTSVEGNVIGFNAYRAAILSLFDTTQEGVPVFKSLTDAMNGVGDASSMIASIQEEMATDGFLSFDSLQSLAKQFGSNVGDYITFDNGKPIAEIQKIKDYYVQAIKDMKLESPELEKALIEALNGGFDEAQFNFDALTTAMGKAQNVASVAAAAQKELTYDTVESLRELFGDEFESYINKDAAGNYLSVNTNALKEYAKGLLIAENATAGTLAEFDAMWNNAIEGSNEATTSIDRVSKALTNLGNVSDYLTLLESDDLTFIDALSSAVKLLESMPEEYSLEDFFTFGDNGEITYHTEFLTKWIDKYIDDMVKAGDVTEETGKQMKEAAKAEAKQVDKLEKLTDAMNDVSKAANLMKDAQEEAAESGSNSLDTILSLYEQFGDKANSMLSQTADGKLIINTDAIRQEMYGVIDTLDEVSPEIKQKMKEALNIELDEKAFEEQVDAHVESVKKLQDALAGLRDGGLSDSDIYDLVREFPELTDKTDNLEEAIISLLDSMNTDVVALFAKQFGKVDSAEDRAELQAFMDIVLKLGQVVGNTKFAIDIAAESEGIEQLFDAIKESVSSTGLSSESIANLKKRYQDLDNYNPAKLFERTANGIHLNTSALRKLEKEYEDGVWKENQKTLDGLIEEYKNLSRQIDAAGVAAGTTDLYARRNDILNQINEVAEASAQYEGLTSAFYKWEQAQSMGEEGDMYDSLTGGLKDIKELYKEGLVGTNKFRTAVQLMTNQDMSTASVEELMAAYEKGYPKMQRYFKDSSDGVLYFLNDLKKLNSEWVTLNKDGSWDINFGVGNDQEIADALGINVEAVQSIMRKLSDYGFDINLDSVYTDLDTMATKAEKAAQKLKDIGKTDYTFDVSATNIKRVNEQIEEAGKLLNQFRNEDGSINLSLEGAEEAQYLLASLIMQKQSLDQAAILKIDASNVDGEIGEVVRKLQKIKTDYDNLEVQTAIGADTTQIQADIDSAIASLNSENAEILAKLGIDTASQEAFIASVSAITPSVLVSCGVDETLVTEFKEKDHNTEGTVVYKVDDKAVDRFYPDKKYGSVYYSAHMYAWNPPTKYGTVYYTTKYRSSGSSRPSSDDPDVDVISYARGTAYAKGTLNGDWGTKESGEALGGELGPELLVRDGKYYTIGAESAELFKYKRGDIIFNAAQTKEILDKGKITSASPRGKAFSSGSGTITANGSVVTKPSGGSSSSSSSKSDDEDEPQKIDWIEMAIDRIERAINKLATTASSTYRTLKKRLGATASEIEKVNEELRLQERAYNRYIQEAESINLPANLKAMVRNGSIDIREYNSDTADLIQEYQQWYEKALDCADAIDELHESLSSLYEEKFGIIATDFDNQLSMLEHDLSALENALDIKDAQGYLGGASLYSDMQNIEYQMIKDGEKKLRELTRAMNEAVSSGAIEAGSEAWYEMKAAINETKEQIQESNLAIIEYGNSIRDLEWSHFDYLQDRIASITDETEFLIGLLDDESLYDDRGQLTKAGMATLGMRGVNYNTYLSQASQYAEELRKIEADLSRDPYDTALIERREELLNLQRESISAAEDEKQAIVDLVQEGIDIELSSLNDLIDAYKDSLNSAKDLYDYQKKISSQTSQISSLQKQLSAYAGDTSEENRARVQKLQVSLAEAQDKLEESQYDQYIKDQTVLLDDIYSSYETVLNERLDNVDALISDMIDTVNANADSIASTIIHAGHDVGYYLTENLSSILSGDGSMIAQYSQGFSGQLTTLNSAVNAIKAYVSAMVSAGDYSATSAKAGNIQGFSDGGYVAELQKIAMRNGDDMVTVNTLKRGESVFDQHQTQDLASLARELPTIHNVLDYAKYAQSIPDAPSQASQSISQHFGDLHIEIDHVEDYNDLVTKMRDDPKFEKLVQAMTVDRMVGKSKLSKYKYQWK